MTNDTTINRIANAFEPQSERDAQPPGKSPPGVAAKVRHWVADRPVTCICLATCMGVALGWWIKRR